jgi:hypothetical protein
MISRATHINKTQLKKVNKALAAAGYSEYPGDRTTAQPEGCGSGYLSNLLDYLAAGQSGEQQRVLKIVNDTLL